MHWDGSISLGTVLSLMAIMVTMGFGFHKFLQHQKQEYAVQRESHAMMTAALNNLSTITDRLDKAVQTQNGRLLKVETTLAVREEVDRRMSLMHGRAAIMAGHSPERAL